jgi:beta-N-acetylglucosaminidase
VRAIKILLKQGENMAFKIDLQTKINESFQGPSKSYYDAKNRFDEILTQKLGRPSQATGVLQGRSGATLAATFTDVTLPSGATATAIDEKLKGTALEGLGAAFVKAENEHGVNAWFLTAIATHESGNGTSRIAQDKNNLFGFQAYDATPYASARSFATAADGIDYVASYLSKAYLTPGGAYYNGTSVDAVGKRYATDTGWADAVKRHMIQLTT